MELLAPLLAWLSAHPHWAGLAVFLIAFSESLALVGLFMPGAVLMFGIGALVGSGTLALWPTLAWAAAGAVAGDGISFWLGRHFHERLRELWPFRTHPGLVARATDFFRRHGGKSIMLGRFVGPIRPVIPAVAGMLDMPWSRFLPVNVLSGLLWAPAYVLPGMVFAASLELAAEVAGKLALAVVLLLALLFAVVWSVRRLFALLHPRAHALLQAALLWGERHPAVGRVSAALLDPEHPEARGLTVLALVLLGGSVAFAALLEAGTGGAPASGLDGYVYRSLQDLRTPAMDRLMVLVTQLGDGFTLSGLFLALLAWLARHRRWLAAAHWVAAGLFAWLAPQAIKWITAVERPNALYQGIDALSFPSGHASHSAVLLGFLAVLWAGEMRPARRWLAYAAAGAAATAIGFSRLYLGAHWLSDVLAGLTLGVAWAALLGIAYRRHRHPPLPLRGLVSSALLGLLLAGTYNGIADFEQDLARYAPPRTATQLAAEQWRRDGWATLPTWRGEVFGDEPHPLTVQYAGPLGPLRERLRDSGWRPAPALTATSWLRWLGHADTERLPPLPQVHGGRHEELLLLHGTAADGVWALRLWPSEIRLTPAGGPLWLGNVTRLTATPLLGLLHVPRTTGGFEQGLAVLERTLGSWGRRRAMERRGIELAEWRGRVLLLEAPDGGEASAAPALQAGQGSERGRQQLRQTLQSLPRVVQFQ